LSETHKGQRSGARIPSATYRLQFNQQFTFEQATQILDYLDELGVSDCYASPLFQCGPESTHGYDICDFNKLNPALGTTEQFKSFASALRTRKMGLLLDMVPNHMGCDWANGWWRDVLANGPGSPFAKYFDINWSLPHSGLRDKVLLPILEDHYGKVLEAGKLRLAFADGAFRIAYHDRAFPVSLPSTVALLSELTAAFDGLDKSATSLSELTAMIHAQVNKSPAVRKSVERLVCDYNGVIGDAASFDRLHWLLEKQYYRLAYWKTGPAEINYRRFFDLTDLISVRMELPEVFEASHRLAFQLIATGQVTGLRIDHPDGMWDPKTYFARLQAATTAPVFVVAEKILSDGEQLPEDWQVAGTTGYDFLNHVNGLFVAKENAEQLDQTYQAFSGIAEEPQSVIYACKQQILNTSLKSELSALAHRLRQLGHRSRQSHDINLESFRDAVATVAATFPVYRSYVDEDTKVLPEAQRRYIQQAVDEARWRSPGIDPAAFDFLSSLLLLEVPRDFDAEAQLDARVFVMRFQQLSGPVMAKGLEDTAFYRFNRLISLNEVGGDLTGFGISAQDFHEFNSRQVERWPHSLLSTATHDTKRGEDARARINVLSELPEEWHKTVDQWREANRSFKRQVDGHSAPSANDEYLLYQTIVGAWPVEPDALNSFRERVSAYMLKAAREAKVHTSWLAPNEGYEQALAAFVEGILQERSVFPKAAHQLQQRVTFFGRFNSLSQTVLKLTCPGVPDIYQGTELWDLSLVDPDNRRPVDYELRRKLLAEKVSMSRMGDLLTGDPQGRLKLHVLQKLLHLRRNQQNLFADGSYVPLTASGPRQNHVLAFARVLNDQSVVVLTSRLTCTLMGGQMKLPIGGAWKNTFVDVPKSVASAQLTDALAGWRFNAAEPRIDLEQAFATLPFAVLSSGNG